jgi:hypothetical protein
MLTRGELFLSGLAFKLHCISCCILPPAQLAVSMSAQGLLRSNCIWHKQPPAVQWAACPCAYGPIVHCTYLEPSLCAVFCCTAPAGGQGKHTGEISVVILGR